MKNLSRFYHEMIRENFVEELRENLNLSRMEFNEMSQLSLFIPTTGHFEYMSSQPYVTSSCAP